MIMGNDNNKLNKLRFIMTGILSKVLKKQLSHSYLSMDLCKFKCSEKSPRTYIKENTFKISKLISIRL